MGGGETNAQKDRARTRGSSPGPRAFTESEQERCRPSRRDRSRSAYFVATSEAAEPGESAATTNSARRVTGKFSLRRTAITV